MKILITGGSGFIARRLSACLSIKKSTRIYLTSRGKQRLISSDSRIMHCTYDSVFSSIKKDDLYAIIHCASATPTNTIEMNSILMENIELGILVSEYVRYFKPRVVINFSSVSVYGEIGSKLLSLNTPYVKPNLYGVSKIISEEILESNCADCGSQFISLRIPGTVGKESKGNIISKLGLHLLSSRSEKIRLCSPDSLFNNILTIDPLYRLISDIIFEGLIQVPKITFLLASESPLLFREVIDLMCSMLGANPHDAIEWYESEKSSFYIDISEAVKDQFNPLTTRDSIIAYCEELLSSGR